MHHQRTCLIEQDTASDLPSPEAAAALVTAAEKYREALARLPGHPEAAYNLATCLSEQAELRHEQADQVIEPATEMLKVMVKQLVQHASPQ